MTPVEICHFHLFAGLGGGAKGLQIWGCPIALELTLARGQGG